MIFDYSKYITSKGHSGIVNYQVVDTGLEFFGHTSVCPYCKQAIKNIIYSKSDDSHDDWLFGSFYEFEKVVQCPICGWWEYEYTNQSDAVADGIRASDIEIHSAILKQYNDNDSEIPITLLRNYIETHPDKIYGIDAHKMAELARAVFSDFYPSCTVTAFGKTKDGGKDGLLIDSDGKQTILQVKRRTSPDATEGVGSIRELLGVASLENDRPGCIFVSTADHYSPDAKNTAKKAVKKKVVDRFDLYNCEEFLELVNITRTTPPTAWKELLRLR